MPTTTTTVRNEKTARDLVNWYKKDGVKAKMSRISKNTDYYKQGFRWYVIVEI